MVLGDAVIVPLPPPPPPVPLVYVTAMLTGAAVDGARGVKVTVAWWEVPVKGEPRQAEYEGGVSGGAALDAQPRTATAVVGISRGSTEKVIGVPGVLLVTVTLSLVWKLLLKLAVVLDTLSV